MYTAIRPGSGSLVGRAPEMGRHTDGVHDYGATWLDSRLLNSAKEPADTTDWGRAFHSFDKNSQTLTFVDQSNMK